MVKAAEKKAEKSNVRVVARCRPVNAREIREGGHTVVKFSDTNHGSVELTVDDQPQTFQFDRMFAPDSTQEDVFRDSVFPLINDVLNGYNATVFAYGQTGTGKTHTMEGNVNEAGQEGIIPRSVAALFAGVAEADESVEFTFKVSYVEIYMEKIRDLLDPNRLKNNLTVREDKALGIYIAGVTEEYVTSFDELLHCMQSGAFNRATAATGMNEGSSRSHSVFTITVGQKDMNSATSKNGKLVLVDLAGSEMVRKTGASGQQLEEAKTINKSLSALGQVINALTDEKQSHVPYRDSKLTRVLQDSLGGNSKTVLIVAISPSSYNANETLSTIRFGLRAKAIENKVRVNATRSVEELEQLLARAEKAIDVQAAHILTLTAKLEDGGGVNSPQKGAGNESSEVFSSSPGGGSSGPSAEHIVLMESLQLEVAALHQDLDDERQDSIRKDAELDETTRLLKEKERLLFEAGDLLQEARRHYESQRERGESLVREKTELSAQLTRVTEGMTEELEQAHFAMKETQVSLDTLRAENKTLLAEIAEVSGDTIVYRGDNKAKIADAGRDAVAPPPRRNSVIAPLTSEADRDISIGEAIHSFRALCELKCVAAATTDALLEHIVQEFNRQEDVVVSFETRCAALDKAHQETSKRVRELEMQRTRLESDLATRTESAVRTKLELETLMSQTASTVLDGRPAGKASNSGLNKEEIAALLSIQEKTRVHNKSLQQRLEQLVAVHRQLLRKFASLELDIGELRKLLSLRDERITQLEGNAKNATGNMRAQGERHVAELTNLREQIRLMKEEHLQRTDQAQHYLDLQLLVGRDNSSPGARRTMRGGQTTTTGSNESAGSSGGGILGIGGGRGSFSRPKSIQGGRPLTSIKSMHGLGGSSGVATPDAEGKHSSVSSFQSMMTRLGVR